MTHFTNTLSARLDGLLANGTENLLRGGLKGIEKESLRISRDGIIAHTPHPYALGSALTHPHITTDYSEALIELITPPFTDIQDTLDYLQRVHQFVYAHLEQELLLGASMPCGISGDESIPIAEYGSSNVGRMKHIYRHGLWHRYGRTMQAIAGIHFNYSVPEALWPVLHSQENSPLSLADFIAASYFGLIRNFQRVGWLILYLFGASPAICKSFFKSRPDLMAQFEQFDGHTLYHPYATSLRMSDIGYKSLNQANLDIDYNSLAGYVESLSQAINTPYPEYEKIGTVVDGEYRQLNTHILQIENEFYSTIRPKQIAQSCEKPTVALKRRGVRYVEMRSLDLDVFHPLGIETDTAYFIETLLLTCLLTDSPLMGGHDHRINNSNQLAVAHAGRKPGLELARNGGTILLQDWAHEILAAMQPVCSVLDADNPHQPYTTALKTQQAKADNPDLTASARLLAVMRERPQPFASFAIGQSVEHANYFNDQTLDDKTAQTFVDMAVQSHARQQFIESQPQLPFAEFLHRYFTQTCTEPS
ncbi:MAG: glutamate--cysteine ligase [Methylovulum sp.]|uniref:glutamate--cysteine ligase n=1 Tax=Methylovulum sp. TaxID=1916980 RepID=UPI00263018D4|nr:glutamate--cysteine ligase [Methylovulum sp.]MDD2724834.1 glutamate--cysteine ligase [Methylovulum sp.]MDD5124954.1 glutamate--cysteine ligase [Methylovulum sp.]